MKCRCGYPAGVTCSSYLSGEGGVVAMKKYTLVCLMLLLGACNGGGDAGDGTENREHVWSEQVNTINKAENVEDILGDASARQRQQIDEQMQ